MKEELRALKALLAMPCHPTKTTPLAADGPEYTLTLTLFYTWCLQTQPQPHLRNYVHEYGELFELQLDWILPYCFSLWCALQYVGYSAIPNLCPPDPHQAGALRYPLFAH